ncbi:MAG: multidrug effflux MFS transporter [Betaproteobacteria bacterium]|nr:multidrug effflux MFS transporter [Betaproteobacteria bacterium]
MLAGLAMLGPFSIDTYLPSFPAIQGHFAVTPLEVQQTLSAYLATFAVMSLFHGTLSDSFGRRRVILASLAVFVLASVGCAAAQSFGQLLAFRGAQGLSAGVGWVVGRAIIRDSFAGFEAQRLMSLVTMIFGLAPALAPVIGGWLQGWLGWQSVFAFLALYGALLLVGCWVRLPETHPREARQPFALVPLSRNYLRLASDVRLVLLCLAIAFNFSGFFLYISSAPAFIYNLLGLEETDFAVLFVPGIAGVMFGAFLSGRAAGRFTGQRTVGSGYLVMFGAVAFNVGYHAYFPPALPWSVLPVMCYTTGMALVMPSVTLILLDLFLENRGLASSLQGFTHSCFAALTAGFVSPLLSGSGLTLALGQAAALMLGGLCWVSYRRIESRGAATRMP